MEERKQTLSHQKPLEENELEIKRSSSQSPGQPTARSADGPICLPDRPISPPPDFKICSADRAITRSPDSQKCRECLGAMAHRLAQPMTALRGGMELGLMGKRTVADYRALLEQSLQLADGMVQLIVSLRDLGESSAPGVTLQSVALRFAVEETLAEMEGVAQARNLHLQLDADGAGEVCADPVRLREALQSLLDWVIQNSAGGGIVTLKLSTAEGAPRMFIKPTRLDLQYLQIKMLEDITTPGQLFSHAAKHGALGWAINQRLLDGLGSKLEMITDGLDAGCIRVTFPTEPTG